MQSCTKLLQRLFYRLPHYKDESCKFGHTANATATGGRDGQATSDDQKTGVLSLSTPRELGGAGGEGTNQNNYSQLVTRPASSAP